MPVPVLAMELARDRLAPGALTAATLFATIYGPDDAKTAGYLDEVADEGSVLDTALAHAERLGALPREPYAKTKNALREKTVKYIRATLDEDMARLTVPTPSS
ncbi:MAG: hypothetical protein R3B70_38130 [Polyangiaceae bacterium]